MTSENTANSASPDPSSGSSSESSSDRSPHTFQVDLRGLVDLLSHHLYSSPARLPPRAAAERRGRDHRPARRPSPTRPPWSGCTASGRALRIEDSGIGLTEAEVHRFLATIGRSSKRGGEHGLESARAGVPRPVRHRPARLLRRRPARSAWSPAPPAPRGRARRVAGHATTVRTPSATLPDDARPEPGTTVVLAPRPGAEEWIAAGPGRASSPATTAPCCRTTSPSTTATPRPAGHRPARRLGPAPTPPRPPAASRSPGTAHELFGFTPLDIIDLDLPVAGVRGVAYVLPEPTSPAHRAGHRVHLKGMLLTDQADDLLPDWAFFVRVRRRHGHAAAHRVAREPVRRRDAGRRTGRARRPGPRLAHRARRERSRSGWPRSCASTTSA